MLLDRLPWLRKWRCKLCGWTGFRARNVKRCPNCKMKALEASP